MQAFNRKLADSLFRWREHCLRLFVDPFDRLHLKATGRSDWPPYSLRRHVGSPAKYSEAARQTEEWIARFDLLMAPATVLDIGCGCGSMVAIFARLLDAGSRYIGFDVHSGSIAYCRKAFAADGRFRFELAEIGSPYGARQGPAADLYAFPAEDSSVDFALAKSVFTHLGQDEARHYLREIARTLKPGGFALISAFLFTLPGENDQLFAALGHPADRAAKIRWRVAARPEAAIGFEGELFLQWIAAAGLGVREFVPIFWPGKSSVLRGQDLLVLGKSAG